MIVRFVLHLNGGVQEPPISVAGSPFRNRLLTQRSIPRFVPSNLRVFIVEVVGVTGVGALSVEFWHSPNTAFAKFVRRRLD